MAKTKEQMIPGRKYRGWGFINEYKEFCFEPEQTGANAGQVKQICIKDGVAVSETKNFILIRAKIEKNNDKSQGIKLLSHLYNTLVNIFQEYAL